MRALRVVEGVGAAQVEDALAEALGAKVRLTAVPNVKFLNPLGPDVPLDIDLTIGNGGARFACRAEGRELAAGRLEFARDA